MGIYQHVFVYVFVCIPMLYLLIVSVCVCLYLYVYVFTKLPNKICIENTDMMHTDTYRYISDTDGMYHDLVCICLYLSRWCLSVSVSIMYVSVCIWLYLSVSDVSVSIVCVSVCSYVSVCITQRQSLCGRSGSAPAGLVDLIKSSHCLPWLP
jgi:hypothetical protein